MTPVAPVGRPEEREADAGGIHRAAYHVLETAHIARETGSYRGLEDLLGEVEQALQRGATPREHDPGRDPALHARRDERASRQAQDFVDPRFDDLAQDLARDLPRRSVH